MLKKKLISLALLNCLVLSDLSAMTLQESIVDVLDTSPVVKKWLKNYRATQQDLRVAESEYYPQLDLSASIGFNKAGDLKSGDPTKGSDWNHNVRDTSFRDYQSSLTFTQNLFDGFGTMHKVDYQEARILAAAYKYLEVANDEAYKITNLYLEVLKTRELIETAKENVQINEDIYSKVKDLFESGLTTDSEE